MGHAGFPPSLLFSFLEWESPVFGAGFLFHQCDVLLKWHAAAMQPSDGQELDKLARIPDRELLLRCLDDATDLPPNQVTRHIIRLAIDRDTAIGLHFAHEDLSLDAFEPAIGINDLGNGGQGGERSDRPRAFVVEYRADTEEGQRFVEGTSIAFRTTLPFLRKWIRVPDDYEDLY